MADQKSNQLSVDIVRLDHGRDLPLPGYQSPGASGLDLLAAVEMGQELTIHPGARALVPTGISVAIPDGYEAQVRPRSGLAAKHGVTVLNAPGTIDCDYRGEIKVILVNHGQKAFNIARGERIAQLVIHKFERVTLIEVERLSESSRGSGGFGSTGNV